MSSYLRHPRPRRSCTRSSTFGFGYGDQNKSWWLLFLTQNLDRRQEIMLISSSELINTDEESFLFERICGWVAFFTTTALHKSVACTHWPRVCDSQFASFTMLLRLPWLRGLLRFRNSVGRGDLCLWTIFIPDCGTIVPSVHLDKYPRRI